MSRGKPFAVQFEGNMYKKQLCIVAQPQQARQQQLVHLEMQHSMLLKGAAQLVSLRGSRQRQWCTHHAHG
jgi:hypothetical protein